MKSSSQRWATRAGRLLAGVVILSTTVVLINAAVTLTVPNAVTYPYAFAAGTGGNYGIPSGAIDRPVIVMGTCTTVGERGVGQVTLLRPAVAPLFLEWTGLESPWFGGATEITSGYNDAFGTHIVYLDYGHKVDIEVFNGTAFRIQNKSAGARAGHVTMIW
jgi:hypothetical protein